MRKLFVKLPTFRFKVPHITPPKVSLPNVRIPFGRQLVTIGRRTTGSLALLAGITGLTLAFFNPMPYIVSLLPVHYENLLWLGLGVHIDHASVQSLLNIFVVEQIIAASVSATLLVLGIALLRLGLYHALKATIRGFRASPRAFLAAPIAFYRKITKARNWLLEKVEYLQNESAKWKTTFNILKSPYSLLRSMGFSPQMAVGLLFAGSTVGTGVVVNETVFAERSFERGDSGIYAASVIGSGASLDVPTEYVEGSNTLRIDLGSTPVREITIENVSVGTVFTGSALPSGEANVVQISGNTISGGSSTRIHVGHLIFEKSRCKKLTLTDIQAHTVIVEGNASDGPSIAPSPGTSRMRAVGGGHHQAEAMVTSGGTYDRIWIQAPTSGVNGKVDKMTLSNLYTKGGDCVLSKMNIGTLEVRLNEVGMGNGFSTKEFAIATTVTGANITVRDNVEESIGDPPTQ